MDLKIRKSSTRELFGYGILWGWAGGCCVILTLLMAGHTAAFKSSSDERQARFLEQLHPDVRGWQALHVLRSECKCSADVGSHLLARGLDSRLDWETVVLIGNDPERQASFERAGFVYLEMTPGQVVTDIGVESVPTMVLVSTGAVGYLGGYYRHRERTEALDGMIITKVLGGEPVEALPSFGCALSKRLQEAVDPLGLTY